MAKKYRKGVYTLSEIGETVYKKCPGRFKNTESACAMARKTARRLGIGDINGKQRFRFITANDAARIVAAIISTPPKKRKRAEQISLGDILGGDPIDWLEPYTPDTKKEKPEPIQEPEEVPLPAEITQEQWEAFQDFRRAALRFMEVFHIGEKKEEA